MSTTKIHRAVYPQMALSRKQLRQQVQWRSRTRHANKIPLPPIDDVEMIELMEDEDERARAYAVYEGGKRRKAMRDEL